MEGEGEGAFDEGVEEEVDDDEHQHAGQFDGDALGSWTGLHLNPCYILSQTDNQSSREILLVGKNEGFLLYNC